MKPSGWQGTGRERCDATWGFPGRYDPARLTGAIMAEAGEASPHLDQKEQRQAAAGAPMGALVIHEIVRDQGEEELERSFKGLAWSGIAAGLSIGFSFLAQATLQARLPD